MSSRAQSIPCVFQFNLDRHRLHTRFAPFRRFRWSWTRPVLASVYDRVLGFLDASVRGTFYIIRADGHSVIKISALTDDDDGVMPVCGVGCAFSYHLGLEYGSVYGLGEQYCDDSACLEELSWSDLVVEAGKSWVSRGRRERSIWRRCRCEARWRKGTDVLASSRDIKLRRKRKIGKVVRDWKDWRLISSL